MKDKGERQNPFLLFTISPFTLPYFRATPSSD